MSNEEMKTTQGIHNWELNTDNWLHRWWPTELATAGSQFQP